MMPGHEGEEDNCYAFYSSFSDSFEYRAKTWRQAEAECLYQV
jgi:hypothetical protein